MATNLATFNKTQTTFCSKHFGSILSNILLLQKRSWTHFEEPRKYFFNCFNFQTKAVDFEDPGFLKCGASSLFYYCCVFRPAFGCCTHLKAGQNTFFGSFQLFCSFQTVFRDLLFKKYKCWTNLCCII